MNMVTKKTAKANPKAAAKPQAAPSAPKTAKKAGPRKGKAKDIKIKRLQKKIKVKYRPMFRGRFGSRSVRRVSLEKWQKWRRTRGVDTRRNQEDGLVVDSGYRTPTDIPGLHPTPYSQIHLFSPSEVVAKPNVVLRIGRTVGKAKRKLILAKAREIGIEVLN